MLLFLYMTRMTFMIEKANLFNKNIYKFELKKL